MDPAAFVDSANGVLSGLDHRNVLQDTAASFKASLGDVERLLNRNLTDD